MSTATDSFLSSTATLEVANPGAVHWLLAQWMASGEPHGRRSVILHALSQGRALVKYARNPSAVRGWPH